MNTENYSPKFFAMYLKKIRTVKDFLLKKISIYLIFLFVLHVNMQARHVLYVATNGNDLSTGSINYPLRTINKALVLLRKEYTKKIILRGGSYYDVNLNITKADSNLIIKAYKKEDVKLYGGTCINIFEKRSDTLIIALPQEISSTDFQMILVNGEIKKRSRLPDKDFFYYQNNWNVKSLPSLYGNWERKPTAEERSVIKCDSSDLRLWKDEFYNAEISLLHQWDESYTSIDSVISTKNLIFLHDQSEKPLGSNNQKKYIIWNTKIGMKRAGEWYVDKKERKLYYLSQPGETVKEIIIPSFRNTITLENGTKNITLRGITLSASGNKIKNEGFAGTSIDPLIKGMNVSNIKINNIKIKNTNGSAISLKGQNNEISDVTIQNCGGGGIYFEGRDINISRCIIENIGLYFKSSVGILTNGAHSYISDCIIKNTPYSGMCLGLDSSCIKNNIIKNTMYELLDGGALYCEKCFHLNIENNYIVTKNTKGFFKMGIYFDEQCTNCVAMNNVVLNSGIPIHCHMAKYIYYLNNIFMDEQEQSVNTGGSSNISLNGNVFITQSIMFNGPSVFDKKVDTITLSPIFRKYANPNGITTFKNNTIMHLSPDMPKLPQTPEKFVLSGTIGGKIEPKIFKNIYDILQCNDSEKKIHHLLKSKHIKNKVNKYIKDMSLWKQH